MFITEASAKTHKNKESWQSMVFIYHFKQVSTTLTTRFHFVWKTFWIADHQQGGVRQDEPLNDEPEADS